MNKTKRASCWDLTLQGGKNNHFSDSVLCNKFFFKYRFIIQMFCLFCFVFFTLIACVSLFFFFLFDFVIFRLLFKRSPWLFWQEFTFALEQMLVFSGVLLRAHLAALISRRQALISRSRQSTRRCERFHFIFVHFECHSRFQPLALMESWWWNSWSQTIYNKHFSKCFSFALYHVSVFDVRWQGCRTTSRHGLGAVISFRMRFLFPNLVVSDSHPSHSSPSKPIKRIFLTCCTCNTKGRHNALREQRYPPPSVHMRSQTPVIGQCSGECLGRQSTATPPSLRGQAKFALLSNAFQLRLKMFDWFTKQPVAFETSHAPSKLRQIQL